MNGRRIAVRALATLVATLSTVVPVFGMPTPTSPPFALVESNQTTANLGVVAGAGDVNGDGYADVIVGAPLYDAGETDEGAAFVFLGGPNGVAAGSPATASATLQANQTGALFGASVGGAGDVNGDGYDDVIVGAPDYDSGQSNEGAAFVFLGGPAGIANGSPATAATTLQSNQVDADFGVSVAGAGDVNGDGRDDVVVGARLYDGTATDAGGAFVFHGSAAGIASGSPATAAASLVSAQASSGFGGSVASARDVNGDGYADVVVGASGYDSGQTDEGAAFVFHGSPAGIVASGPGTANATLQSDQDGGGMGNSVAGVGDVNGDGYGDLLVGASGYENGAFEGAAFLYSGGPSGIASGGTSLAVAFLSDQVSSALGASVAGAGDLNGDAFADFVVGATAYDSGQIDEGGAFVYLGRPGIFASGATAPSPTAVLAADNVVADYGSAVAGVGDTDQDGYGDLAVGARRYDAGQTDEGAVFVYRGAPYGLTAHQEPATTLRSNQPTSVFGDGVASGGDVNGDGYDDVVVGAPQYDEGEGDEGAVFVFLGGPAGVASATPAAAAATLQSNQVGAQFGTSVAIAGDVNGDGYDDVIVGAPLYDVASVETGAAFVFLGGPAGIANGSAATAATTLHSGQLNSRFGESVASAGDVNNDGRDDVIVGARLYDSGQTNEGAAFVFLGSASGVANGTPATAATVLQADQSDASLGIGVAGAGDVNGDGFDDVVVGATQYDSGQTNEGVALVFLGGASGVPSGTPATAATVLQSDLASGLMGASVSGAGDVNDDGFDDVVVSSGTMVAASFTSAVFVFLGSVSGVASGTPATAATMLVADQPNNGFGRRVARAGDVNGDGYGDVVVTSSSYLVGSDSGAAFVFLGGPVGIPSGTALSAAVTMTRIQIFTFLGQSVSAGDVNGDGFDDIVVGASTARVVEPSEGGVFVFMPAACCRGLPSRDSVGVYAGGSGRWFLRDSNNPGPAHAVFAYGAGGAGYLPIAGDWNGDGVDSPGLYDPATGAFFLRNSSSPGPADLTFVFGAGGAGVVPIVGDWNGDGSDTIGLYNAASGVFFLRNANSGGLASATFGFGPAGASWRAIAGDWDGDGDTTVGLYNPTTGVFFLKNTNAPGPADAAFNFGPGPSAFAPVAGDFDDDGVDTVGLYNPASGAFFLKNANTFGGADVVFGFGQPNATPIVGDWDGRLHRAEP